jgi:hypothetical protein
VDDFEDLVRELRAGADRRGLRLLEAVFPGEPAVIFGQETTSVDEVLDVAQHVFAPFVSVTVSRLDPSELTESWSLDDEQVSSPPAELLRRWEERSGQIDGVFVQWIASGSLYLYPAVPAWKHELEELRENWSVEQDAQRSDLAMAVHIRLTHLAEQLEREPEYRGGTTHTRGSIGKRHLESMLQSNEGSQMTFLVLKEASRLVRENAQAEYSKMLGQMDELAVELCGCRHWLGARFASDRTAAARNLLIKRSGGYSPPGAMINELRRLAEK